MTSQPAAPALSVAPLSASLVFWLACTSGLGVASLYYSQPMLGVLAAGLGASHGQVGWVPTLTQLGYACGIFLLAPLGDRYDRRLIILAKASALGVALLALGAAPSLPLLLIASVATGMAATLAQDVLPAAAALAPESQRGKVVGTVMTGLLLGILLSRVVSGFVAEHWGWRAMYGVAACSIVGIVAVLWRALPRFVPTTQLAYAALLGSLIQLWRRHGALRRATCAQALLSLGFSAFWSTLAVMLQGEPFHLGSTAAGLFGIAGAAGALAAPFAGRFVDRHGPERLTQLGCGLAALAFATMFLASGLPPSPQLWVLGAGAVAFDLGVQATVVAHQNIVYSLEPAARSRLNAVLVTGIFIGMSCGAALASLALTHRGWPGVMALALVAALAALAVRLWRTRGR